MHGLILDKISVIIARCADIYGRNCSKKSNNDHFHPYFAIIVFDITSCSFSVDKNEQTRVRFLVLEKFITEEPRDIAFIPSVLKRVQR